MSEMSVITRVNPSFWSLRPVAFFAAHALAAASIGFVSIPLWPFIPLEQAAGAIPVWLTIYGALSWSAVLQGEDSGQGEDPGQGEDSGQGEDYGGSWLTGVWAWILAMLLLLAWRFAVGGQGAGPDGPLVLGLFGAALYGAAFGVFRQILASPARAARRGPPLPAGSPFPSAIRRH